jgi:putative ABC transport system permease protein
VRTLRGWIVRLVALLRRRARERDMQAELESHLDLHIEHNLRIGMAPQEARRRALMALGGFEQAKEQYRDRAGVPVVETLLRDLRDAGRRLRRSPGPVLIILVTLAVALAVNSTVFAIADSLLLRPLALPDVDRLVLVFETPPGGGRSWTSPATFLDWQRRAKSFRTLVALTIEDAELGDHDRPERIRAASVSHDFFTVVGNPARGRGFIVEESTFGRHRIVVLSDGLWHRRFGADLAIVGRSVVVDGVPHRVIGIAPPRFGFPYGTELWRPMAFEANALAARDNRVLMVMSRLADGATLESAREEMAAIGRSIAQQFPETHKNRGVLVQTLAEGFIEPEVRPLSVLLHASALLVLLIACANITNLLVALGVERRREVAMRYALGATRAAMVRGVWLEHTLLALLSVPLALAVAGAALGLLRASMPARLAVIVPGFELLDVDGRLVVFTSLLAIVAAGFFGAFSAMHATRHEPEVLKEAARAQTAGVSRLRLRRILVVAQVAFVLPLIVTAASSWRGTRQLLNGPHGYDATNVITMRMTLPEWQYPDPSTTRRFVARMLDGLRREPAVNGAAVVNVLPSTNINQTFALEVQGRSAPREEPDYVDDRVVSPAYFETMRIRILKGRAFTDLDADRAAPVAIVSASMAAKYWPGADPIGRGLRDSSVPGAPWIRIVGVANDILDNWYVGGSVPMLYRPYEQDPARDFALTIRTSDAAAALARVRTLIQGIDPARPLNDVMPMREVIEERLTGPRQVAVIMAALGALALLLAVIGLYGVVGYSVSQRTHEIGLRMVLGATQRDVLKLVVGQASRLTLIGLAIGALITLGTTGVARAVTFGIAPFDPRWLVALALIIAAIGLAAAYVPARRALGIPPVIALRHE